MATLNLEANRKLLQMIVSIQTRLVSLHLRTMLPWDPDHQVCTSTITAPHLLTNLQIKLEQLFLT